MRTETERPNIEVWPMLMVGEIFFSAVTMSRSLDWGIDACRPGLDRAQIMTSVVKWDEFHALQFVPRRLLSGNDCDELIPEWLNNVQELAASEGLLQCDEGQGES